MCSTITRTSASSTITNSTSSVDGAVLSTRSTERATASSDRGTYVVQGERITDPAALATLRERGLPDHETAVEIPAALLRFADPVE